MLVKDVNRKIFNLTVSLKIVDLKTMETFCEIYYYYYVGVAHCTDLRSVVKFLEILC